VPGSGGGEESDGTKSSTQTSIMVMTFSLALLTTATTLASMAATSLVLTALAVVLGIATLLLAVASLTDTSLRVDSRDAASN
jgi:hypothetical protein